MTENRINKIISILIVNIMLIFVLSGCEFFNKDSTYLDKATYGDVLPTPDNIMELAVSDKTYTTSSLGLTSDEISAINYYKNNTVTFIDLGEMLNQVYEGKDGKEYSVSNYAYDIKLIETVFGIKTETIFVNDSSDIIQTIETGQADIITELLYTDERAQYIDFAAAPSVHGTKYYYSLSNSGTDPFVELLKMDEAARVVGILPSFTELSSNFIDTYGLQVMYYADHASALAAINNGTIKGFISSNTNSTVLGNLSITDITRYNTSKSYSVAYKKDDQNIEHLANAIHKLLDSDNRQQYNKLLNTLLLSMGTYLTQSEKDAIAYYDSTPLKVEMPPDNFPDSYIDSNGNWAGIAVDSFEYRAKILGLNYEFVSTIDSTTNSVMNNVGQNGNTPVSDVAIGLWYTDDRNEYLDFSDPLVDVNFVLVGRVDLPDIVSLDEMTDVNIGITSGYGYIDMILNYAFSPTKEYKEYKNELELMQAYKDGEVDYFMVSERSLQCIKQCISCMMLMLNIYLVRVHMLVMDLLRVHTVQV